MLRCALILTPIALPFVVFGLALPEDIWILMTLPVVVGWVLAMIGCVHSKRLRDEVVAGTRTVSSTRKSSLVFVVAFTVGVALASELSLPLTRARGHMSGLLPWTFGFCSIVFAGLCVLAHEVAMVVRVNRK
jgi:uncharacterized membrane protein